MTLPAIKGFIKAVARREASTRSSAIMDVAIASNTDGKTIKQTIKDFQAFIKKSYEGE